MIVVIRRTLRRFLQLQQVGSKSNIIYRTLCDVMRTLLQHSFENDDSVHFIFRAKMSVEDFAQFLKNEQRDAIGDDVSKVSHDILFACVLSLLAAAAQCVDVVCVCSRHLRTAHLSQRRQLRILGGRRPWLRVRVRTGLRGSQLRTYVDSRTPSLKHGVHHMV